MYSTISLVFVFQGFPYNIPNNVFLRLDPGMRAGRPERGPHRARGGGSALSTKS